MWIFLSSFPSHAIVTVQNNCRGMYIISIHPTSIAWSQAPGASTAVAIAAFPKTPQLCTHVRLNFWLSRGVNVTFAPSSVAPHLGPVPTSPPRPSVASWKGTRLWASTFCDACLEGATYPFKSSAFLPVHGGSDCSSRVLRMREKLNTKPLACSHVLMDVQNYHWFYMGNALSVLVLFLKMSRMKPNKGRSLVLLHIRVNCPGCSRIQRLEKVARAPILSYPRLIPGGQHWPSCDLMALPQALVSV